MAGGCFGARDRFDRQITGRFITPAFVPRWPEIDPVNRNHWLTRQEKKVNLGIISNPANVWIVCVDVCWKNAKQDVEEQKL